MQLQLFTIPVGDSGGSLEAMNRFLRSHKVLEVSERFVESSAGGCWCFCVRYIESTLSVNVKPRKKVDYKHVLEPHVFEKFTKLREVRKQVSIEEAIPAFAVFTDEELAGLAKLECINHQTMRSVKGVGDKKAARFGKYFMASGE